MNPNNLAVPDTGLTNTSSNRYIKFRSEVNRNRKKLRRPQRTSTPVDCSVDRSEYNTSESYSDSVGEFFYQSWKNELTSDNCEQEKRVSQPPASGNIVQNFNYYIVNNNYPVWCPSQMVYVNTVTTYAAPSVTYCPAVGYRADGTYGILPGVWYCYYR